MTVRRIAKDGIFLALLCVTGMLAIPMGDNIKVSLQFLTLLIIFSLSDHLVDAIIIPALYLAVGLLIPVYAGFTIGITPTFGFVIAFPLASIPFYFIIKYININFYIRFILAALSSLLVIYIGGVIFMMPYLNISLEKVLLIAVVPYLGFDAIKIAIALLVIKLLPSNIKPSYIN